MKHQSNALMRVKLTTACLLISVWHVNADLVRTPSGTKESTQRTGLLQQVQIQGRVISSAGEALQGVNVRVKGMTTGTVTDANGQFTLSVPDANAVLEITSLGYNPQEVSVGGQKVLTIVLEEDTESLDEVVVIGYGTRKRTSVTSSISKIENVKLDQVPNGRIENTLAGRIAGVNITNSRNVPGAAPQVRIRGLGSISAGNDPLIVIDGFPGGSLGQLNMNDVESVEVLKDASSTAIYGSRGASGVILITTKRGVSGKPTLKLDSYYGVSKAMVHDDWLTGEEWYGYLTKYQNREFAWAGGDPSLPIFGDSRRPLTYQVNPLARDLPQTIWQDEVIQNAPIQNHNISVSGGSERVKYYVSGTFADEKVVLKTAGYRQYSVRRSEERR